MKKHTFQEYLKKELRSKTFKKGFEEARRRLNVGYQVAVAREKADLTQAELADIIGTRQANISRLERGSYNFTIEMLQKIAMALNSSLMIKLTTAKKAA